VLRAGCSASLRTPQAGVSMNPVSLPAFLGVLIVSCSTVSIGQTNKNLEPFCNLLRNDVKEDVGTLFNKFGNPKEVSIKYYPNKHIGDATDEIHSAEFGDGVVAIYSVPAIDRNYILRIVLTSKFWPEGLPTYVDQTLKDVVSAFGTPDKASENGYQYFCDIESTDYIQFMFEANQVTKLRVQRWID
jgi:hypothetical protein